MLGDYEVFKSEIYALTKIDLNAYKERQMKRRVDALITKHSVTSYKEYVLQLKQNKIWYEEFVNYLTINVSEFYRNPEQWKILEDEIFPYLIKNSGQNLKIWSAACSTGDEPYSLVMALSRKMPLSRIKIIATDIDKQILEKAQAGLYHEKSLKGLPKEFISKYFEKINDKTYAISEQVKSCVEFKQHNLLKDEYPKGCDLIVCRNVMIYFTEEAKMEIYKKFNASLKSDSILFVGSTEQIIQPNVIGFKSFRSFFYQKFE